MKNLLFLLVFVLISCQGRDSDPEPISKPYHIVFVTGDEEYRSEESMPMLAKIVQRELGTTIEAIFSVDSSGYIDPNRTDHIAGLESLENADMMVLFTRFRNLPPEEAAYITDFAESGKPMVGFRTSTHAFYYPEDSTMMHLNAEWPAQIFGQQWVTHHGHFEDGHEPLTKVAIAENQQEASNPILNGVDSFKTMSWLYHVDGGEWELQGDCTPLLTGTSLRSKHEDAGRLDQFPLQQPVAWTKSYQGKQAKQAARVFFTTLGHPYDFKEVGFRKLVVNGIAWAMGREKDIPENGFSVDFMGAYEPNNSGFGDKFKQGLRPEDMIK